MHSHQARNFGFFHKEQSDCASEQYETQNLEAIAIGEQKCLTLDRAAGSTDRAQVSRIRIAALRGEVRCRLLQAFAHCAGVDGYRFSDALGMEPLSYRK